MPLEKLAIGATNGMVLVTSQTFTSVTNVSVTQCFSSAYQNYKVMFEWQQSSNQGVQIDFFLLSGTSTEETDYATNRIEASFGTVGMLAPSSPMPNIFISNAGLYGGSSTIEIYKPYLNSSTVKCRGSYQSMGFDYTPSPIVYDNYQVLGGFLNTGNNPITGCKFSLLYYGPPNSMTGTVKVYGYLD